MGSAAGSSKDDLYAATRSAATKGNGSFVPKSSAPAQAQDVSGPVARWIPSQRSQLVQRLVVRSFTFARRESFVVGGLFEGIVRVTDWSANPTRVLFIIKSNVRISAR